VSARRWWSDAPVAVSGELVAAQQQAWHDIAGAGTWWSGAQRIALAEVAREALSDPHRLPPWVLPSSVPGRVAAGSPIPDVAVDAAHRIAGSPQTLTEDWYRGVLSRGLTAGEYVETVAVVVRVAAVDTFARMAGLTPPPFEPSRPGEPERTLPAAAGVDRHWVPTIRPDDVPPELAGMYGEGGAPNVMRALSAVPDELRRLRPLQAAGYVPGEHMMDVTWDRGGLDRRQIELIAAATSAAHECFY
jgi:hypothetical protein